MAFGLKNDFRNEMFEGSKYLLLYADKLEELKTICWFCDNAYGKRGNRPHCRRFGLDRLHRLDDHQCNVDSSLPFYDKTPVCRKHYLHPEITNPAK
jgi:thymidine kinase